jgi:hypothetical protein
MSTETNRHPRIKLFMTLGLSALVLLLNAVPHVVVSGQVSTISPNTITIATEGRRWRIPYYRSFPLEQSNASAERAIIIIHGIERRADLSFDALLQSAKHAGSADETTLLFAPQFLMEADVDAHPVDYSVPYWTGSRWAQGDQSSSSMRNPRHGSVSSFLILDKILERLGDRSAFPRLKWIIVAGHSAGGQFVNRYAIGNGVEEGLARRGIRVRYVVANPGSYLYLEEMRRVPGTTASFARPSGRQIARARNYNDYKYGLNRLNLYMKRAGLQTMLARYPQREVTYLLGDRDNDPKHPALDRSPAALLQGANRQERGRLYYAHLLHLYGPQITLTQQLEIVHNAGHSARRMFDSTPGAHWLFGRTPVLSIP